MWKLATNDDEETHLHTKTDSTNTLPKATNERSGVEGTEKVEKPMIHWTPDEVCAWLKQIGIRYHPISNNVYSCFNEPKCKECINK